MTVVSPCVGLCRIEAASDLCTGCARSRVEIASWRSMTSDALGQVWAALPARRAALGIGPHRLAWTAEDVRRFAIDGLRPGSGTWVFGVPGALAEFTVDVGEAVIRHRDGDALTALTERGAIHLAGFDGMRALALGRGAWPEASSVTALVVPCGRIEISAPSVLTNLGPDRGSIDPSGSGHTLYDLGLGSSPSRFCVRVGDPELRARLDACCGEPWQVFLPRLSSLLVEASPPRVVVSPIGRVEVFAPIPPPGGASRPGPHTHLLPASLAAGHEAPPALGIPASYAVGALHHPAPTQH